MEKFFIILGTAIVCLYLYWKIFRTRIKSCGSKDKHTELPPLETFKQFGEFCRTHSPLPGCVADENELPISKVKINVAIIRLFCCNYSKEQLIAILRIGYELSRWQQGVGNRQKVYDIAEFHKHLQQIHMNESDSNAEIARPEEIERWKYMIEQEKQMLAKCLTSTINTK